ncbi:glutathione synthase [Polynucleobacter sp. UK-FUSCHL-C3]|uniref:Glutathione synthetase n=1 Tax=Polynucleobacter sp. UK-FUSCHL-C3 TaxID=2955208 RepID=A0AAU8A1X2_9BURK
MKLLFITDPLDSFKVEKDTTLAMMRVAQSAGHEIWYTQSHDLLWGQGKARARAQPLTITSDLIWYRLGEVEEHSLDYFTAVLMRQDPPFTVEYLTSTWILSAAVLQGARVFNNPDAVRNHSEKLSITEFPQFIPPTLVTRDIHAIRDFHGLHHDIVIKPLDGMGGMGVFRVGSNGLNLGSIVETLGENGSRTLMAQRFLPEITAGDKRVLLIGGEVMPYALARIPQGTEIRGNLAVGGKGLAMALTAREEEIANHLAPILAQRGLFLVGLDMIGGYLTEINVTSPTCFVEIAQQTDYDVAKKWLTRLEKELA